LGLDTGPWKRGMDGAKTELRGFTSELKTAARDARFLLTGGGITGAFMGGFNIGKKIEQAFDISGMFSRWFNDAETFGAQMDAWKAERAKNVAQREDMTKQIKQQNELVGAIDAVQEKNDELVKTDEEKARELVKQRIALDAQYERQKTALNAAKEGLEYERVKTDILKTELAIEESKLAVMRLAKGMDADLTAQIARDKPEAAKPLALNPAYQSSMEDYRRMKSRDAIDARIAGVTSGAISVPVGGISADSYARMGAQVGGSNGGGAIDRAVAVLEEIRNLTALRLQLAEDET
jgi:hypothetical protein